MVYIVVTWALVFALLLWLMARHVVQVETINLPPPADPYEGQMTDWRRRVHDWTRDN